MTWYEYGVIWIAGWWLISTACLRYTPRVCPRTKLELETVWGNGSHKMVKHRVNLSDEECWKRRHFFHVRPYDYALWVGASWPLWIALAIPVLVIYWLVMSSGKLGRANWYMDIQREKAKDLEEIQDV